MPESAIFSVIWRENGYIIVLRDSGYLELRVGDRERAEALATSAGLVHQSERTFDRDEWTRPR